MAAETERETKLRTWKINNNKKLIKKYRNRVSESDKEQQMKRNLEQFGAVWTELVPV